MRKYLLPESGKYYKANLHMHTVISDGAQTPEEVKRCYMAEGYSVVAFTDHDVLLSHKELTDENFVAITSCEKEVDQPAQNWTFAKVMHMNFYAKDEDNLSLPILSPKAAQWCNSRNYVTEEMKKYSYEAEYSEECFNDMIKKANDAGFLVSFNHPVWSIQNYADYKNLKGLWGVEVYNTDCALSGSPDTVQPYEDLLRLGERVFPLCTDDSHRLDDRFGGYVMIKAEELKYGVIMSALEKGDFYASCGPEIKNLYLEDGALVVECSAARSVTLQTERRVHKRRTMQSEQRLTRAVFDVAPLLECSQENSYIRVTVTGYDGKEAYTRAYFIDELKA